MRIINQHEDPVLLKIIELAANYSEIKCLALFGSRARGDNAKQSDYDIAVFPTGTGFVKKLAFINDLDDIDTLIKIDLVVVDGDLDQALKANIDKDGVILLERKSKADSYHKAVERLNEAFIEYEANPTDLGRDGVIQRFEFSVELAWKACREYLIEVGFGDINAPKPVMREAFSSGLIVDEQIWVNILNDRNLTSHLYDEKLADHIFENIKVNYLKPMLDLAAKL